MYASHIKHQIEFLGENRVKKQIAALATDENNIVMWDMDALLADYGEHPYVSVDTEKLVPQSWLSIDEEYALKTDVKLPLILFEISHGLLYVADGNHRLYKATKEHIQKMNVRIIPEKIHQVISAISDFLQKYVHK